MLKIPFLKKPDPIHVHAELAERLVEAMRHEMRDGNWFGGSGLGKIAEARPDLHDAVLGVKETNRGMMALALLRKATSIPREGYGHREDQIREDLIALADSLVSSRSALDPELFPAFVEAWIAAPLYGVHYARIVTIASNLIAGGGITSEVRTTLQRVLEGMERTGGWQVSGTELRRQALRINQLLDPASAFTLGIPEPWQAPFRNEAWKPLIEHAAAAKGTAPSERWTKAARPLLDAAGHEAFLDAFGTSVDEIQKMPVAVDALHSDMLRGLAWIAGLTGTPRAASLLGRLAIAGAHKIVNVGARSPKGFSGAVGALERMGTFPALAALSNARNRVKAATLCAALTAALDRAAERQGLPMEELEELVVPTYGLTLPGFRIETLGEIEVRLEIVGTVDVELRWSRGGKPLKAAPTEAKALAKALGAEKKEIEAALVAQRSRIEGLMLSGRTLPSSQWRERYLDHPLLAHIARRLVWRFSCSPLPSGGEGSGVRGNDRLAISPNGVPLDIEGRPFEGLDDATTVRLWHPIDAGASAIEAWREFLLAHEIRQPFKQAYREIYLLTDAEERTRTYSNRFAAHVLKQHQMAALARGRGWRYALQGYFDNPDCHPTLDLPAWGLRAEFFVEVPDMNPEFGETMTEFGIATYVVTDQTRFVDRADGAPVPLADVPPVLLSEVLRDVDLFVGVASVGNDPGWMDAGERQGYGDYWRSFAFGDLSATAETRRAVLERLLPRLAIGRVSRIEGRFLCVEGKRRTYKIHLGSGNILMEPNDQYLCIVPGSVKATGERLFLPFEGDGVLAIVLSKATLLMNDDRITDPTITRQF